MDWLGNFFQANTVSLVTLVVIVIVLIWTIKKGLISFNGKELKVGDNKDRITIRNQWEYANSTCEAQFINIRPYCSSDFEAKYIIARIEDVFQAAVIYNYMSEDESYIRAKQSLVLNTVQKRSTNEYFFTQEFKDYISDFTQSLIKDLIRMKRL